MDRESVFAKVKLAFENVLDEIEIELTEATIAEDVEEWDSLAHIQIITEIEKSFNVRFTIKDIEGLKNIGDMISLIIAKSEN